MELPSAGQSREDVLARMRELKAADADWRGGRTWSLVHPAGEDVDAVLREAADLYLFDNALNSARFPSLKQMEADVVSMAASDSLDIMAVGDGMDDRGWHLDRQTAPPALHMMVTPNHAKIVDVFLADLRAAATTTAPSRGVEARYSR